MFKVEFKPGTLSHERFHINGVLFYLRSIDNYMANVIFSRFGENQLHSVAVPIQDIRILV